MASGSSKNSLTEAIGNAVADILSGGNGDHKYSLTVIVDGYAYDGEEYHVTIRVVMFDLDEDREELYRELEKEREERAQAEPDLANDMYAAFYNKDSFYSDDDDVAEKIQDMMENQDDFNPPETTTVIASPGMHDQLERETGQEKERTLVAGKDFSRADTGPGLHPPGMSSGGGASPKPSSETGQAA